MAIEVIFRGPTLYLHRGNVAEMALVPDAERVIFSDSGKAGFHPDGSQTNTHYAGLLIVEGDTKDIVVMRAELSGKIVTLIDGKDMECSLNPDFNDLIPIDQVANSGKANNPMELISSSANDFWTRVAARVLFRGGTLGSDVVSPATFRIDSDIEEFKNPRNIPLCAKWTATSGDVHIQMCDADGSDCVRINLKEGQHAFIYNWDVKAPVAHGIDGLLEMPDVEDRGKDNDDIDFKWLYQLYVPPAPTFTAWLGGRGASLRAPITTFVDIDAKGGEAPPNPGSSGCASARGTLG